MKHLKRMARGRHVGLSQGISGEDVSDNDRSHSFGIVFSDTKLWVALTAASVSTVMFVTTYQTSNAGRCNVSLTASEASAFLRQYVVSMRSTQWQSVFTSKSGALFEVNTVSGTAEQALWSQFTDVNITSVQASADGRYARYGISGTTFDGETTRFDIDYQVACEGVVPVYARRCDPGRAKIISGGVPSLSAAEQSELNVAGIAASGLPVGISTLSSPTNAPDTASAGSGAGGGGQGETASNLTKLDFTSGSFGEREATDFFEAYLKDIRGPHYEEAFTRYLGDTYYKKLSGSESTPVGVHQYWAEFDTVTIMGTTSAGSGKYRLLIYAKSDGDKHKVKIQWKVACRDSSQSLDSCPASDLYIIDGRVI